MIHKITPSTYLNGLLIGMDELVLLDFTGVQEHEATDVALVLPLVHLVGSPLVTVQRFPKAEFVYLGTDRRTDGLLRY